MMRWAREAVNIKRGKGEFTAGYGRLMEVNIDRDDNTSDEKELYCTLIGCPRNDRY